MTASAAPAPIDDDDYVVFAVPVDCATVAWLIELAELRGFEPRFIAVAILRDVREDDQRLHDEEPVDISKFTLN